MGVSHEPEIGGYMAPFVMGPLNTRVVRRSNALQDYAYGREFRYRELMRGGELPFGPVVAGAVAGGLAALYGGMSFGPTRKLLDRVLPDPGEGPSEKTRENGLLQDRDPLVHEQRRAHRLRHQGERRSRATRRPA